MTLDRFSNCVAYSLGLLLDEAGSTGQSPKERVQYSNEVGRPRKGPLVQILPSGFFDEGTYVTAPSLPVLPLPQIEGVPLLFGTPRVERNGNRLIVHADIIASAYFMATRYEEVVRRDVRDEHGRFPGRQSLAFRAGFINRPLVEEYAALLRKWLREVGVDVPEPKREFSVLVTHDVDHLRCYAKWHQPYHAVARALLGRCPRRSILEALGCAWGLKHDPWDTFDDMIQMDISSGYEPVYFLMAGGNSQHDRRYKIRGSGARRLVEKLQATGAIIGLHTSYQAGMHPGLIAQEKAALEEVCGTTINRNRHHFLAWREVEDGRALAKAGIDWDATLGYPDLPGFRLGVCHPIPLFDPINMSPMGITEHPLIIMDSTLSDPQYMNLGEEEALSLTTSLMHQTRKHRGEFVILWHNTSFAPEAGNHHRRLYRCLLEAGKSVDLGNGQGT